MGSFDVPLDDERTQLEAFVEEYRSALESTLDGLTDEQVRRRLVPSATTLLGLLKARHLDAASVVRGVHRRYTPSGTRPVQSPEESFQLGDDDTVTSVKAAHRQPCATARSAVAGLSLDAVVTGHRAGPRTVHWVYLQVLRDWPTTAVTPTSCANRHSPAEHGAILGRWRSRPSRAICVPGSQ
jgi:hypothetical protein